MSDQDNPLTEENYQALNTVLASTARTRELLSKCHDCGFDVQAAIEENERQSSLVTAIKAKFFPGRP